MAEIKFDGTLASVCDYLEITSVYSEKVLTLLQKIKVTNIECDSRRVTPGTIFYARRGAHYNPFEHLDEIKAKGAVAILIDGPVDFTEDGSALWLDDEHPKLKVPAPMLVDPYETLRHERRCGNLTVTQYRSDPERAAACYRATDGSAAAKAINKVKMLRLVLPNNKSLSALAGFIYGNPSQKLRLIGVTGTNGKSTITNLIAQMLNACGHKTALFGTLGYGFLDDLQPSANTTLDAISLQRELAHYVELGADYAVMEVSSIGFCEGRVSGLTFHAGAFSNLSRDHLDYHQTMEEYFQAKLNFLRMIPPTRLVINCAQEVGRRVNEAVPNCYTVKLDQPDSDKPLNQGLSLRRVNFKRQSLELYLNTGNSNTMRTELNLLGAFNAENYAIALGVLLCMGYDYKFLLRITPKLKPITGRMECFSLNSGEKPRLIVDYAHTPDGVEQALRATQAHTAGGRIFVVLGCGGDRDRGKRPLMAMKASVYADYAIFTADNPRSEDLARIIDDMIMAIGPTQEELTLQRLVEQARAPFMDDRAELAPAPGATKSAAKATATSDASEGAAAGTSALADYIKMYQEHTLSYPELQRHALALQADTPEAYDELRYKYDHTIVNFAPHGTYYHKHAQCEGLPLGLPSADNLERNVLVIGDRYQAIRYAFEHATKRDSVLIAGKGHEDYQIFKDGTIHFSDREVCCELLGIELPASQAPAHETSDQVTAPASTKAPAQSDAQPDVLPDQDQPQAAKPKIAAKPKASAKAAQPVAKAAAKSAAKTTKAKTSAKPKKVAAKEQ